VISPRSLGSWCIKGTNESVFRVDSSVPLMHHDPSDLDPDPDHPKGTHPGSLRLIVRNSSILSDSLLLVAMLFSVVLRSPTFILFSQCRIIC